MTLAEKVNATGMNHGVMSAARKYNLLALYVHLYFILTLTY